MKTWFNNPVAVRQQILVGCQNQQYLQPAIVEKDWWVTAVLHALFQTSCAKYLIFKGGTSLSKGWNVIDRFSEDIDLALHRSFFGIEKTSKNQKEKLRKTGRKYIVDELSKELDQQLALMGISGYRVESVTTKTTRDGLVVPVDSDKDPTVINVYYDSVAAGAVPYAQTAVKIEISCISMDEPSEVRMISSLVEQTFPGEDKDVTSQIRTVVPTRTFLEKIFLLAEEFQKEKPRSIRMTRHLYDLERLMDKSSDWLHLMMVNYMLPSLSTALFIMIFHPSIIRSTIQQQSPSSLPMVLSRSGRRTMAICRLLSSMVHRFHFLICLLGCRNYRIVSVK